MNILCPSISHGGLKSTLGGDRLAPCILPAPLGSSSEIDSREADENGDFILAIFSFTPAVGDPLLAGWTPPPERFLFDGAERFLAGPLASARTLVGAPPFERRVLLTLDRTPDAVIADGAVGIAPDLMSTTAAETPNECTERGQAFLFSGTYHCRQFPNPPSVVLVLSWCYYDPWGPCADEEEGGWPASIGIPRDE